MDYDENLKKLKSVSQKGEIAQDFKQSNKPLTVYSGFIGRKVLIKPYTNPDLGFYLDDDNIYQNFIALLKQNTVHNLGIDISLIQSLIDEYFKDLPSGVKIVCEKMLRENKLHHSIKDYQNQGGKCIHKSSLALNLLLLAGYDARVVFTNVGSENHAFIIIKDENKYFIFDPSNHSRAITSASVIKVPTVVEKQASDISSFLEGKSPLEITQKDEEAKNAKQTSNVKISLPKLRYETRSKTSYINLNQDEVDKYIEYLKTKGLLDDEIKSILRKIKSDLEQENFSLKVSSLSPVYEKLAQVENIETYFKR